MFKRIFCLKTLIILLILLPTFLGFIMIIPGAGFQSLIFINSVKSQIKKTMPKNKYVLDGSNPFYISAVNSIIKKTYIADILSVTNWNNMKESGSEENREKFTKYAEDWYEKTYTKKVASREDIDINFVCLDMVKFDEKACKDLFNPVYVETGIQWMFSGGLKSLFNSSGKDLIEEARVKQTVVKQSSYENNLVYTNHTLDGPTVYWSNGNYVVNSKVWLLNLQQESMRAAASLGLLKNKNIKPNDIFWNITPNDIKAPNYILGIYATFIGYVIFFLIAPIWIISFVLFIFIRKHIKYRKKRGKQNA